ncbi:MAG: hypothetical protein JSS00_03815 [Proteobacteria bacterium]|nr:hypothetical protein [Pseudomonadota bacterium]
MPFYFSWGETFLAIYGEFWPWQIAAIRVEAEEQFERRPQDDDLECAAQIRASIIPSEMYGYGFVLMLREDVWTLEVAEFPPHAAPGERIRKARSARERKERREKRGGKPVRTGGKPDQGRGAKKPRKRRQDGNEGDARIASFVEERARLALAKLYNTSFEAYRKLRRFRRKLAVLFGHINEAFPTRTLTVQQEILRWITPSKEECRAANIAAWTHDPLPCGHQRERRLFFADFLPMWFDTIAPIEPIFVRGGKSIFGELFLESECAL